MRKAYKRLTYIDRKKIEKMYKAGVKPKDMAPEIGVHLATIYHELQRGGKPYNARTAQDTL